ncbi:hypothetical protein MVEN_00234100 [Mycena venus]|uniref:Uncharacterized protein n=1 Tax=Mycena venus TaxID=2733690 RepID=A0A8H7DED4_9AGAR|nr:hypothetical protein MVEN_00234100 [Mycena venus]
MSSHQAEDLELVAPRAVAQDDTDAFNSVVIMEEGRSPDNVPSSDSTTDNLTVISLSRRISELEDSINSAQRRSPKVKVTAWRLLNTFLLLGLGIYKAMASYRGQETAPTTLDWIIGVLWALIAYWVSFLEDAELGPEWRWFLTHDVSGIFRTPLLFLSSTRSRARSAHGVLPVFEVLPAYSLGPTHTSFVTRSIRGVLAVLSHLRTPLLFLIYTSAFGLLTWGITASIQRLEDPEGVSSTVTGKQFGKGLMLTSAIVSCFGLVCYGCKRGRKSESNMMYRRWR